MVMFKNYTTEYQQNEQSAFTSNYLT